MLCRLVLDKQVPVAQKAKLAGAIAYFISPIDLIPESFTGPLGYMDDIVVAALALNDLISETNSEIVKQHWAGDEDVLDLIKQILHLADEMVGSGLWERIQKGFGK